MNDMEEGGNPTRERLLAAGRLLFARDGFEGASIRDITGEAGANLGAVTYHFGCKEALYHEVLRGVLEPLRDRILPICGTTDPPLERLAAVIRGFFQHLESSPEQPRFFLQEMVIDGPPPPPILGVMLPVSMAVAGVVAEGQRDGSIRPGIPHLFVLSLFAQPIYMALITRKMQGGMDGALPPVGTIREAMVEHAVEFALGGLRADGVGPAPVSVPSPGEPGGDLGVLSPPHPPDPASGSHR
jgi:AcrR family transcriptional regulator